MSQYSLELCSADSLHYLSNHSKPSLLLLRVILGLTSCTRLQLSLGTSVSLLRLVKAESQSQSVFCGRGFCKAIRLVVLEDLFLERPAKESAQQTESRGLAGKRWLLVPSFGYFWLKFQDILRHVEAHIPKLTVAAPALPRLLLKKACRKHQPCHALLGAVLAAAQEFLKCVLQLRKPKLEPALRPLRQPTRALDTQKGNDQSFLMSVFLSISTISIQMPWRDNFPNVNLSETK